MMVVTCYRSEDADENSLLYNKIVSFREKSKESSSYIMTEMEVHSFHENDVSKIISPLMPLNDDDEIRRLSILCVKRTMGNPYFVIEFVKMLESEGLISYEPHSQKWDWDLTEIENATMSTANVAILLQARMRKMPKHTQQFLQFAAFLGSFFSLKTMEIVWKKYNFTQGQSAVELIDIVEKENFVERCGPMKWKWSHDKVQEAAMSLAGTLSKSFQFDIGTTLYYCLDSEERSDAIFSIVDLINNGNEKQRPEFAEANLEAAEKARSISAFHSAAKYAAHGIDILPYEHWNTKRAISLRLYRLAVEMELVLGNIESANRYSAEVFTRREFNTMDLFPLNLARAKTLSTVELKFQEALDLSLKSLKDLGRKLIWNARLLPLQAVTVLLRTINKIKRSPPGFHQNLKRMTDPKQRAIAEFLAQTQYAAYNTSNPYLIILCACERVKMTMKFGVFHSSSVCFVALGVFVRLLQHDYALSARFVNDALAIQKKFGGPKEAECVYSAYAYGLSWNEPLRSCKPPVIDAFNSGLRRGDNEFALWNLMTYYITLPYAMGEPLDPILKACPKVLSQCIDHARKSSIEYPYASVV